MSNPVRRYLFDPTGTSPNNFVANEEHVLGPKQGPYHPIAPRYGPYYNSTETLRVYSGSKLLTPGVDYFGTTLIQKATADVGIEVNELILLKNREEGETIRISYQNVGGHWQNNATGIIDLYNAFLKDNRPVEWANVMNKPTTFPPAYHLHLLKDVVGWEGLIVAIERLCNVLTLRNVPAFEALIDWVMTKSVEFVTEDEVREIVHADKAVSLRRMVFAAEKLNFNTVIIKPRQLERRPPEFFILDLDFTNFEEEEAVYWDIAHENTFPDMFKADKGRLRSVNKRALLVIQTIRQPNSAGVFPFVIRLRRNSPEGPVFAMSPTLKLKHSNTQDIDYGALNNGLWSIPTTLCSSLVRSTPESLFLIPDDYFFKETSL